MNVLLLRVFLVAFAAAAAQADVVYFKDGAQIEGDVRQLDAARVIIRVGRGRMVVPAADIDRIDRSGAGPVRQANGLFLGPRDAQLLAVTGLDRDQRDRVEQLLRLLESGDPIIGQSARLHLIELQREMDVFRFLQACLPYMDALAPEILPVLAVIDPERARPALLKAAASPRPANRAAALALLGEHGAPEDAALIARGVKDEDVNVQLSAFAALGALGAPRATPVLLQAATATDPRIRNAALSALAELWSNANDPIFFDTLDEWRAFWERKRISVSNPLDWARLTRLAPPGPSAPEVLATR
jgi:hypothetical protein